MATWAAQGGIVQLKPNAVTTLPPKPNTRFVGTNNNPSLTFRTEPSDPRGTVVPIPNLGSHPRSQHPSSRGNRAENAAIFHRQIKARGEKNQNQIPAPIFPDGHRGVFHNLLSPLLFCPISSPRLQPGGRLGGASPAAASHSDTLGTKLKQQILAPPPTSPNLYYSSS